MDYLTEGRPLLDRYISGEIDLTEAELDDLKACMDEYTKPIQTQYYIHNPNDKVIFLESATDKQKDQIKTFIALLKLRKGLREETTVNFEATLEKFRDKAERFNNLEGPVIVADLPDLDTPPTIWNRVKTLFILGGLVLIIRPVISLRRYVLRVRSRV